MEHSIPKTELNYAIQRRVAYVRLTSTVTVMTKQTRNDDA
jgi:hypothetical protein